MTSFGIKAVTLIITELFIKAALGKILEQAIGL